MSQHEIEIILARQLASYLAVPIFLVDPEGTLLFYNEPAEAVLGRRFEETGSMAVGEWSTVYEPSNGDGSSIPPDEIPLVIALRERRFAHRRFWIRGLDGKPREIEATAFPLLGQTGRFLGAISVFWEGE